MLEDNINQGQDQAALPVTNQQTLSYAEQKSRADFLQDSSSESDEELFMLQISQKVGQMDNEEENNNEVPRTRNEKVVQLKVDEKPETKEERELKFSFTSDSNPQLVEVGYLECIMKDSIIIHPGSTGVILNLDQLVITESKLIIGVIEDVFGRIETPHYRVLNDPYTQQMIKDGKLNLQDKLYIDSSNKRLLCLDHLQILMKYFIPTISRKKGCDASNQFDEEVDDREKEYSDDENEQVHKSKKNKNKAKKQDVPPKQQHVIPSPKANHHPKPYNQNQQQYPKQQHQQQFIPQQQQFAPQQHFSNQNPNFQGQQQQFYNPQQQFQNPQQQYPPQQQQQFSLPQQQQFPAPQQQQFPHAQQQQFQQQFPTPAQQQYPSNPQYSQQQGTQLPSQFVQIGAQYFTMLPGGIPNLLNPKSENQK